MNAMLPPPDPMQQSSNSTTHVCPSMISLGFEVLSFEHKKDQHYSIKPSHEHAHLISH
jgi:hypothetical protein